MSWPPGILGSLLFPWKNSTRSFSLDLLYWSDRMPHFDRNLAPYCFLGVGCHKDKSGHNSDVRQEHPSQLQLAGEKAKNKEGIFIDQLLFRTIFPIFSPRNLGWSMLPQQVWYMKNCKNCYWFHSGMGLLTNAGPQPWHPGNHILSNQWKPFLWNYRWPVNQHLLNWGSWPRKPENFARRTTLSSAR